MTEQQMLDWVANASYLQLLSKMRFAPIGDPFFVNPAAYSAFTKRMSDFEAEDPGIRARTSKQLSW